MYRPMIAIAAALAIVAASCGGTDAAGVATLEDPTPAGDVAATGETGSDTAQSDEEALLAFTQCMRGQGIDLGDPTVDADGNLRLPPPPAQQGTGRFGGEEGRAAFASCSEHLEGVALGFRDRDQTEFQDRLLEFAACMRTNGYSMPDPDFSTVGPGQGGAGPFAGIDRDDPAFIAAQEACSDILEGFRGPGGGQGQTNGDG